MNARDRIARAIAIRRAGEAQAVAARGVITLTLAERLTRESQAQRFVRKHGPVRLWTHLPAGTHSIATFADGTAMVFPRPTKGH